MKKVYVASPFFNRFERLVRDMMVEDNGPEYEYLRPDLTKASGEYAKCSIEDRKKWAVEVFHENLRMIKECDILLFPRYTDDIGTLFEVGYALSQGKYIHRYNYLSRKIEEVKTTDTFITNLNLSETIFIDGQVSAVRFGFTAGLKPDLTLKFRMRKGVKPNIMFSANYTEVDKDGNIVEQDWSQVQ